MGFFFLLLYGAFFWAIYAALCDWRLRPEWRATLSDYLLGRPLSWRESFPLTMMRGMIGMALRYRRERWRLDFLAIVIVTAMQGAIWFSLFYSPNTSTDLPWPTNWLGPLWAVFVLTAIGSLSAFSLWYLKRRIFINIYQRSPEAGPEMWSRSFADFIATLLSPVILTLLFTPILLLLALIGVNANILLVFVALCFAAVLIYLPTLMVFALCLVGGLLRLLLRIGPLVPRPWFEAAATAHPYKTLLVLLGCPALLLAAIRCSPPAVAHET